jgi:heptosyltransferase III
MGFRFNLDGDQPLPPQEKKPPSLPQEAPSRVSSMLILHQGALGDFILALPSLEILRKTFPRARAVFMGYPRILELVEKRFYAEEVLSIDQKGMASFFVREGTLDPPLTKFFSTFDLIAVFGKDGEGNLIRNLKRVNTGQILHINPFPRWDERIHLTNHLLKELSRYRFSTPGGFPRLYLNEADRMWGKAYWIERGVTPEERGEMIIIHPGSGSKKKVWPLDRFLNLTEFLKRYLGSKILVVLGPAEGAEVRKAFEAENSPVLFLAKGLPLVRLASVMDGCRCFIGNDSGISHLAAALRVPTIAIFGPTDPMVWAPRGERAVVVRRGLPCSPCPPERYFQCQHVECLKGIEMEDVLEGIQRLGFIHEGSRKEARDGGKESG